MDCTFDIHIFCNRHSGLCLVRMRRRLRGEVHILLTVQYKAGGVIKMQAIVSSKCAL